MTLNDLLKREVVSKPEGETLGRIVDVLIDVATGQLVYALVSQRFADAPLILNRDRLSVDEVEGPLKAHVEGADLDAMRAGPGSERTPDAPLDLTAMPPVIVGPFGNVVAPAMGAALFDALAGRNREERPALDARHADWQWFETLHGLPVFDATGELGALDDIVIDPDRLICRALSLRDAGGKLYSFPFGSIRMVSKGETSIVLELSPKPAYSVDRIREELR